MQAQLPVPIGHQTVFRLAWPILVSMLSYTAMTVADSIFVAQLGTTPLAAIGLAATGVWLLTAFPMGLLTGARVQIAQATGAAEHSRARHLAWQAVYIGSAASLLVVCITPFSPLYMGLLGAEGELAELGAAYLGVRLAGVPLFFGSFALAAWFQGRGDTRTPMVAGVLANAVNIGLDPLFIFGWGGFPELGVRGAAVATVIAWALQATILGALASKQLLAHRVGLRRDLLARIWRTGLPMGTSQVLDVASFVLFSAMLAHVGDAQLAAHVIVVRILMVSFLPGYAIGEAAGVLVGQAVGAGRPQAARQAWWAATQQAVGLMLTLGAVFLLLPRPLVAVFGAEPLVASIAIEVLGLAALIQVFDAAAMVAFGALNGAGDTRFTMTWGLAITWLAKVPMSAFGVLWLGWGAYGAWLGIAVEVVLLASIGIHRVRGSRWLGEVEPPIDAAAIARAAA